jgi:hypothetical protein
MPAGFQRIVLPVGHNIDEGVRRVVLQQVDELIRTSDRELFCQAAQHAVLLAVRRNAV